jgi:hypothetical protein
MFAWLKNPLSNRTVPIRDQEAGRPPAACPAATASRLAAMSAIAVATWAASLGSWVTRGSRNSPSRVRRAWPL